MPAASTSFHRLNADRHLGKPAQVAYFFFNWLNNLFPYVNVDRELAIRDFREASLDTYWDRLAPDASPSRKLSDLFWLTLPWDAIRAELGDIHLLDVGCGRGDYVPRLLSWAQGHIGSYTGTDVQEYDTWKVHQAHDSRIRFYRSDVADFRRTVPDRANFLMSQSAIEHFDEDLRFFAQVRGFVLKSRRNMLQVHLCPSQACLRLYLLHGVRQYTPRTISKMARLFLSDGYAVLYRLGGRACNRLHYEFITKPLLIQRVGDLRKLRPEEYVRRSSEAMSTDMTRPNRSPAFYAMVIHSNWQCRLF